MPDHYSDIAGAALLPRHVAIIMDGNGRWAKERGLPRAEGHRMGAQSVRIIVEECRRLNIPYLTLYAFSEENWSRPASEVKALMTLLGRFLKAEQKRMQDNGIRLNAIGCLDHLPEKTSVQLQKVMEATSAGRDMTLTLALSYGSRQELTSAVKELCRQARAGSLDPEALDQEQIARRLDTRDLPDPDLLIRTSGELRISNFLLWQMAYTEFYFTEVMWPDFREPELAAALTSFSRRQRRFGKTEEQMGECK